MATYGPVNLPAFFNTDADFRTWGSGISAALAAIGLVQTADSGQINWSTVTKPSSSNASQGYEIWRFNDSYQGGVPVYLKVEYGSAAGAVDRPQIWITVGSATNGSGTLTGQVGARNASGAAASKSSGVTLPFYASGGADAIYLAFNIDSAGTTFGCFASVERTKDASGNDTADGIVQLASNSNTSQFIPASGSVPGAATNWPAVNPSFYNRSLSGGSADTCPLLVPLQGVWRYSKVQITASADFGVLGTWTGNQFGNQHTFLALNTTCNTTNITGGLGIGSNPGISMPWE